MDDIVSIRCRVELLGGDFTLRIPLAAGGDRLAPVASGIGQIEGDYLCVVIRPSLAKDMRITEGRFVVVDNRDGKFNLTHRTDACASLRQLHLLQQCGEPAILTKAVPQRIHPDENHSNVPLRVRPFEPVERLYIVAEPEMNECDVVRRHVGLLRRVHQHA